MKQGLTLEDKLGYWLERYAWSRCSAFDIYLVIEEHYPFITEDKIITMCMQFEKEVNNEKYEYFGIDWHIDNFINNLKNTIK